MSEVAAFDGLVEEIRASGRITGDDVLQLRRRIFPDGVVSPDEAQAVFELDHACKDKDGAWTRFYVDALTDYFVWQSDPKGYVSDEQARLLIDSIACDGHLDEMSEMELLISVVHWATWCPEALSLFALDCVRQSVLSPATACYGSNRPPRVISPGDVALIRKVIYAPGSPGGFTVTRREAELIFDLNDATVEAENASAWRDLFVKAVANHLMFPRGAPKVPDAVEAKRREAWLNDRQGVGRLLAGIGRSVARLDIPVGEAWREADLFGTRKAAEEQAKEEAQVREALRREALDAAEAAWLSERIGRDGTLHEAERALLAFIKLNSPHIDPSLDGLFAKAGL